MDKRPCTLCATAASFLCCLFGALKVIWSHLSPVLIGFAIGLLALFAASFLGGCGSYGYKSEYVANVSGKKPVELGELYYATETKAVESSKQVAEKLASACVEASKQIGVPLAPAEAIIPRTEMAVSGTGKEFDIVKSIPPDPLLPLAQERTKQMWAIAHSVIRTAELARVSIAAPPGYVGDVVPPAPLYDAFLPLLDNLPDGKQPESTPAPSYDDIREDALHKMIDGEQR